MPSPSPRPPFRGTLRGCRPSIIRAELTANCAPSTATRYAQVLARMVEWGQAHGARDAAQVVSLYRAAIHAGQRPESERVVVRSLAARLEAR